MIVIYVSLAVWQASVRMISLYQTCLRRTGLWTSPKRISKLQGPPPPFDSAGLSSGKAGICSLVSLGTGIWSLVGKVAVTVEVVYLHSE